MQRHTIHTVAATVALALIGFGAAGRVAATQTQTPPKTTPAAKPAAPTGQTFATPEEAVAAALKAAAAGAEAVLAMLGPDAKDLVYSSDAVADQKERADFIRWANEKTKLEKDPADPNRVTVLIGNDEFPTAIPLVRKNGKWFWDAAEGRYELLLRRVGGNELDAITICRGFVEAQWQYAILDPDKTGLHQYAQKIISSAGRHDGLYWPPAADGPESPIGEGISRAIAQGYTDKTQPYHGYYLRVLTAQGPSAPLGAMDFMVKGHMIGGFALIAWPAQYRVSGVKTFMVGSAGIVYEQDLGPDTLKLASAITKFDPGKGWTVTEDAR
jgi:hypothetical protein